MSLIYLAIYTGFTRISDYKHHWSDVMIGLIQGTVVAIITAHYVGRFFRRYPDKVGGREALRVSSTFVRPNYSSVSSQHQSSRSPSSPLPPPPSIPASPATSSHTNHYCNSPNSVRFSNNPIPATSSQNPSFSVSTSTSVNNSMTNNSNCSPIPSSTYSFVATT